MNMNNATENTENMTSAWKNPSLNDLIQYIWNTTPLSVKFGIIIDKNFSWKSKLLVLTACINRELTTQILTYLRNKNYIKL